jgi:hypothetical protein
MLDWENWDWNLIGFNFLSYVVTLIVYGIHVDRQEKVASPLGKFLLGVGLFIIFVSVVTSFSFGAWYANEYYVTAIVYAGISTLISIKILIDVFNTSKEVDWKIILNFLISPLLIGIYVFLLISVLSIIYIPIVNQLWISSIHILSIGLGWLTATLFILSYLGLVLVLLMWSFLKSDGRTTTGFSGNYTAGGSGSVLLMVLTAIVIGSIIRNFSTMPTWCEEIMCWQS